MSNKLTTIMYHYVRDLKYSRYPNIKGLSTELFKEQVSYLKKRYNFVKIEDVIEAYSVGNILPDNPVLLTFDDAYADHFTNVFPILEHEHIQGCFYPPVKAITEHIVLDVNKIHFILASTDESKYPFLLREIKQMLDNYREEFHLNSYEYFFNKLAAANRFDSKEVIFVKRLLQVELDEKLRKIITDSLFKKIVGIDEETFSRELYMSMDQIKCMVECGMHIGSHGYDHYFLGSLSKEKQEFEIKKSIEFIDSIGGDINNWSICYPYGNYNEDTISILRQYGCKLGFTTRVDKVDLSDTTLEAKYKLARLDTNDFPKDCSANTDNWIDR